MKFSIIVLMYNASIRSVLLTLKSILLQSFSEYEIIIADDGSLNRWELEIRDYFDKWRFTNYKFAPSQENVGTVKNILRALSYSDGKYIKCLGAGDLLFDSNALSIVYEKMERERIPWIFGDMEGYGIFDEKITNKSFFAPIDKKPYIKKDRGMIKRNIVVLQDYISGASMFFDKYFLEDKLNEVKNSVKYIEDILQVLAVLQEEFPVALFRKLVIYEVGTGISTERKRDSRLEKDMDQFNGYLYQNYSDELIERRRQRQYMIRQGGFLRKHVYLLLHFPRRVFLKIYIYWKHRDARKGLGFLDDPDFYQEFGLQRG